MRGLLLGLALLFSSPSQAQDNKTTGISFTDFSGGLNTWKKGIYLNDNETPSCSNVIFDKNGAISKRQGYTKRNTVAIGDGSSDVDSVYQLEQSNGNKYCVAFSSTSGYSSTDGCQSFTSFVSTLTKNVGSNDVNCDAMQDRLYCVNNQYNFLFNGTDDANVSQMPANLKYIRVYRNRCFATGASGSPSRVYFSALGDCLSWNVAKDFFDISPEDGDVNTGIGEPLYDSLPLYKKFSTWALKGQTPDSFILVNVSKNTGAINHRTMANFNNLQYFDSVGPNGGRPGIYAFNGIVITEASTKLRNEIDNLDTSKAALGLRLFDLKKDWDSGIFDPKAMSTSRTVGILQSSFTSFTDTLTSDFALGGTSIPYSGSLTTDAVKAGVVFFNSGFELGAGTWTYNGSFGSLDDSANYTDCGDWNSGGTLGWQCLTDNNALTTTIQILNADTSAVLQTATVNHSGPPSCTAGSINTKAETAANFQIKVIGASSVVLALSPSFKKVDRVPYKVKERVGGCFCAGCGTTPGSQGFDFPEPFYAKSSTYTSQCFDMAISTPVFSTFQTHVSSSSNRSVTFYTQTSTSCTGAFSNPLAQSTFTKIGSPSRQFVEYLAEFTTDIATNSASVLDATVAAASTGTWNSGEIFLSNNMTSWQLFQTVQIVAGSQANITYGIKSSTYSGGTASSFTITGITPGSVPQISTGAYVVIYATFTIGVATETASLDSLTINWQEGRQAKSATMKVFNNRLHYAAQPLNGDKNSVMYVLDSQGAWSKWNGLYPRMLNVVSQNFLMSGSSTTGGGFIYKIYDSDGDDGNPITAFWESKDLSLGGIHKVKAIDRIFPVLASGNASINMTVRADGSVTSSTFPFTTTSANNFVIRQKSILPPVNGNTFRVGFNNSALSSPFDILGFLLYYRDLGLMQP